jgi:hypothetical protein
VQELLGGLPKGFADLYRPGAALALELPVLSEVFRTRKAAFLCRNSPVLCQQSSENVVFLNFGRR